MKTLTAKLTCLMLLILVSCSTGSEDALLPTDITTPEILVDLSDSEWFLVGCPDIEYLSINTFSECQYLEWLNFEDNKVGIRHTNNSIITPHHICFVNGKTLVVSIQDCENTTWKSLFEWDIKTMNSNTLIMDVRAPNIAPGYKQQFEYVKVG